MFSNMWWSTLGLDLILMGVQKMSGFNFPYYFLDEVSGFPSGYTGTLSNTFSLKDDGNFRVSYEGRLAYENLRCVR